MKNWTFLFKIYGAKSESVEIWKCECLALDTALICRYPQYRGYVIYITTRGELPLFISVDACPSKMSINV